MIFSAAERRSFGWHALVVAVIALGMWRVAPSRTGQVMGVLFALALLPVPPVVIYLVRRGRQ